MLSGGIKKTKGMKWVYLFTYQIIYKTTIFIEQKKLVQIKTLSHWLNPSFGMLFQIQYNLITDTDI